MTVLLNASSGTGEKEDVLGRLRDALASHGVEADLSLVPTGDELVARAGRAARDGAAVVVAGGGDGTVSAVAGAVAGTGATLGVLPLGTLNHFAKDLGIPLDLSGAVDTLVNGRVVEVDVGEANGRVFVNNSSLGLYASLVRERERQQQRGFRKWVALAIASVKVLRRLRVLRVYLSTRDHALVRKTALVFVGNNVYEMEGLEVGARDRLDAGRLSVCVAHSDGLRGLLRLALSALLGRLGEARDFDVLCVEEVRIEARRGRLPVAFDGEVTLMETPLRYRIRPRALRVLVPADGTR